MHDLMFQKRGHHPLVIRNRKKAQKLRKGGVQQQLALES